MTRFAREIGMFSIQKEELVVVEVGQSAGAIVTGQAFGTELLPVLAHKNWIGLLVAGITRLLGKYDHMIARY